MRRLIWLTLLLLIGASAAAAQEQPVALSDRPKPPAHAAPAGGALTTESLCLLFESAASANGLPLDFFVRLIWQESRFKPDALGPLTRGGQRASGIAQFMPGTARQYGLTDPFDPAQSIDAQAHLMRDLLRRFASVPLALAAYNAGSAPVAACGCIPAIPETQAYVAKILGLLGGAGQGPAQLTVRLVA
jgi:soluble lytic murein transglycosylase-like protein